MSTIGNLGREEKYLLVNEYISWNVCLTCAKNRRLSGCSSDLDDGGGVAAADSEGGPRVAEKK